MNKEKPKTVPASQSEQNTQNKQSILTWTAPVHAVHERSILWYIVAAVIIALCGIFAVWTASWSFLIILVLMTGVYLFVHRGPAAEKTISVYEDGFLFGKKSIGWEECSGFWLLQGRGYIELHIGRKKASDLTIQTGHVEIEKIRAVFGAILTEQLDKRENILDTIIRICKL